METVDLQKYLLLALAIWAWIKIKIDQISRVLEPVVKHVEQLSLDGVLDLADRKSTAWKFVNELEAQKVIRLNVLSRFIVGKVIDHVAKKLPDFKVNVAVAKMADKVRASNV